MRLKKSYSSREVASLTGLTARQLQWWDERRLFVATIPPHRTPAGGYTERRYSPIDLIELLALAELLRHGLTAQRIRQLLEALRQQFGIRLFDAIGGGGAVTLLTDGREVYARTRSGEFFNLLRAPDQPLLVVGDAGGLKELTGRARARRRPKRRRGAGRETD
jgi:DNA-binding transcriptional MerR regulator